MSSMMRTNRLQGISSLSPADQVPACCSQHSPFPSLTAGDQEAFMTFELHLMQGYVYRSVCKT